MQEYVGKEMIGFKFEDTAYVDYSWEHDECLKVIGTIVEVEKDDDDGNYSCRVGFPNNEEGEWYPMNNIDDYIVDPTPVDLNELFNLIKQI